MTILEFKTKNQSPVHGLPKNCRSRGELEVKVRLLVGLWQDVWEELRLKFDFSQTLPKNVRPDYLSWPANLLLSWPQRRTWPKK